MTSITSSAPNSSASCSIWARTVLGVPTIIRFRFSRTCGFSKSVYGYTSAFSGVGVPFDGIPCAERISERSSEEAIRSASSSVSAHAKKTATACLGFCSTSEG